MFDPVWLGNHIVPRWEAILSVGLLFVVAALVVIAVAAAVGWAAKAVWKQFRF